MSFDLKTITLLIIQTSLGTQKNFIFVIKDLKFVEKYMENHLLFLENLSEYDWYPTNKSILDKKAIQYVQKKAVNLKLVNYQSTLLNKFKIF